MNVSLTPELERYVKAKVKSGYYNNASEVVREALREMILLDRVESSRRRAAPGLAETAVAFQPQKAVRSKGARAAKEERALERLRAEIQKGIDSPDDLDFSFDKLRASLSRKRRAKAK